MTKKEQIEQLRNAMGVTAERHGCDCGNGADVLSGGHRSGGNKGEFTCPGWVKTNLLEMLVEQSGVKLEDLRAYAKGGSLYGWMVKNPKKYYAPHTLEDFGVKKPPMSWQYVDIPF